MEKYCIVYIYKDKRVVPIKITTTSNKLPLATYPNGDIVLSLKQYNSKEDAIRAIKNKEFIPVKQALKILNESEKYDNGMDQNAFINAEVQQIKGQMRSKGLFDSLSSIKSQLFDADPGTKSSFNNLVKYFTEHLTILDKKILNNNYIEINLKTRKHGSGTTRIHFNKEDSLDQRKTKIKERLRKMSNDYERIQDSLSASVDINTKNGLKTYHINYWD